MATIKTDEGTGYLTLGDAADRLGCQQWKLVRLFERGLYPEPMRLGRFRVVRLSEMPALKEAMRKAGYVK